MLIITPEIITNFEKYHVCGKNQILVAIEEHQNIFDAIEKGDAQLAKEAMKRHFSLLYEYCYHTEE